MELNFVQFLIVCPLVFLAGFVDSIAGGGGLISLPAYMIAGLPAHIAIGTNKLSSSMGSVISTVKYARAGFIDIRKVIFCVAFAYGGSTLGANVALMVSDHFFKIIMLIVIPLTAVYVLLRKNALSEKPAYGTVKTILLACSISFVLGFYDGFYGPGTGTFLILLLVNVAHFTLNDANGAAKTINMTTNIAALVVYIMNGVVVFPLGLVAGLFSIAGTYLGSRLFIRDGAKIVKPVMVGVLVIFFVKIIVELIG